jgi:hypothetical protein
MRERGGEELLCYSKPLRTFSAMLKSLAKLRWLVGMEGDERQKEAEVTAERWGGVNEWSRQLPNACDAATKRKSLERRRTKEAAREELLARDELEEEQENWKGGDNERSGMETRRECTYSIRDDRSEGLEELERLWRER